MQSAGAPRRPLPPHRGVRVRTDTAQTPMLGHRADSTAQLVWKTAQAQPANNVPQCAIALAHFFRERLLQNLMAVLPCFSSLSADDRTDLVRRLKNKEYEEEDENSNMTLANRLRLAFKDMQPDTICGKFPNAELPLKRRLRCVAEYLIRSGEFDKVKNEQGKLVKKKGILGKMVVIYKPLPKMLQSLSKQDLLNHGT